MQRRAKLFLIFGGITALLLLVSTLSIFWAQLAPAVVVPVTGLVLLVVVFEFRSYFNATSDDHAPNHSPQPENPEETDPGIKLLRILIIALGVIFLINVAMFAVLAWRGTLDDYDLRRFIPKALFAFAMVGYILQKIKAKTRS